MQYATQSNIDNEILKLQGAGEGGSSVEDEAEKESQRAFVEQLRCNGEERVKQAKQHMKESTK